MIDRDLQKELLERMKQKYPDKIFTTIGALNRATNYQSIKFNLTYLQEHGLIEQAFAEVDLATINGDGTGTEDAYTVSGKITNTGIDFLEEDGGISAILGTVTVKLHADTIRDLIDSKILQSDAIPEEQKPALRKAIKGMKEEGLKQLTTRLVTYGLDQGAMTAQQLWQMISTT